MSNSDTLPASHYPRFRPFPNETCDRSVRVYSHGFLFVLAVNRIACAGRAPVSSRAPRRVAMPTTWERTHHANPDARQHQHHTPTLRSLEPYYYYYYYYYYYNLIIIIIIYYYIIRRSRSYGILIWKNTSFSPGIVNQGRRSICPIHCLQFRHR